MKPTPTLLDTIKSSDGNNIIYRPAEHIYGLIEELHNNLLSLTDEEKDLYFTMIHNHGDVIKKVFGEMDDEVNSTLKNSNRAPGFLYDENMNLEGDEWFNSYLSWKQRQE